MNRAGRGDRVEYALPQHISSLGEVALSAHIFAFAFWGLDRNRFERRARVIREPASSNASTRSSPGTMDPSFTGGRALTEASDCQKHHTQQYALGFSGFSNLRGSRVT
ncbi:MAG: hypothetical protein ACTIJ6_10250 [Leucobacter sp.]